MKIAIGCDHRGFELKEAVKKSLTDREVEVEDFGPFDTSPSDYPVHARLVAMAVAQGPSTLGILICGSGIGMSIAANKVPRVRAALCTTPDMARKSRLHNNANILCLGRDLMPLEENLQIMETWISCEFEGAVRHKRRIQKIRMSESYMVEPLEMYENDSEVYAALNDETESQRRHINLIASENIVSRTVREALGSVLTNKHAEGYPGERRYSGCEHVDRIERLAVARAKRVFDAQHANVQPYSGSLANMAVYFSVLEKGGSVLAMRMAQAGRGTHGHSDNISGLSYEVTRYGVDRQTEQIDYDEVAELAARVKPRLIVVGSTAYSRIIDFQRFREIADKVGAYVLADISHVAGLVAAGCHPNPVPYCEFVTASTHKTLRGPHGGLILCQERFAEDIDRQVFPELQGEPMMHAIAAKAVCLYEAQRPSFRKYQEQVVRNAQKLAEELAGRGLRIVSGGTDNHMLCVDLTSTGISGKDATEALEQAGIHVNEIELPFDSESPRSRSGIKLGTPTVTALGMKDDEMRAIAELLGSALKQASKPKQLKLIRKQVEELALAFRQACT